ncbi:unnamed protein product [Cladocopium goreaui]|uniref:Ankyrin-1 n=1 Tax=Cladocopium goreaui TaxID=2562237 RepID=A0A9P1GRF0_9DINO|nr:unnamed protein product [Cladocopium goreaui]
MPWQRPLGKKRFDADISAGQLRMADVELPESLKCDGNFKLEIKRLSKEWRLKRDSFRTSVPIVEPEEQLVSAAAAGDLQRCRELLQRKAAAPDAAYVSWIHNISALVLPPPNNSAREREP